MRSPADILFQLLEKELLFTGYQATVGYFPDAADNALCINDTEGFQDGRIMQTGERIDHPGVQILVRGKDYVPTFTKINSIALFLDRQRNVSIVMESDEAYILNNVRRTGTVSYLGVETQGTKRRHVFTVNQVVTLTKTE